MQNPTHDTLDRQIPPCPTSRLRGQVALVTGAGRGIGRAIALAFGFEGASVACIARTEAEIQSAVDEINLNQTSSRAAIALVYDLTNIPGIPALLSSIEAQLGPITILVNNAGIALINALSQHNPDLRAWEKVITTNLTSPAAIMSCVLPSMLCRSSGTIISIGSRNVTHDIPYTSAYSVAKTGLLKMHQSVEAEVGGRGVCNYYLQPGNVDTGILERQGAVDRMSLRGHEGVSRVVQRVKEASKISAETVAEACVMLVTDEASRLLSGKYVDLEHDIVGMLEDLRRGKDSECVRRDLYRLKVESL
ncbi:NAD(P)-binding protein [Trichoderma citrinoviride]|uniref:NAD(P)-binding protein n=1 Tax=Trichoderma citrinoviride TaxID=58853 RepID=A0A2T4AXP6_9HYPO|nr:NAD(P)-binding protein [Trichoderma citrinoviride]PTB61864.1 NAD(P)-binding protein [Trichoderma citrinoviride]